MNRTKNELLQSCIEQFKHIDNVNNSKTLNTTKSLIMEINKAINYTHCCKELKGKLTLSFDDWKTFLYKPNPITYLVSNKEYEIDELPAVYKRLTDKNL